MRLHAPFPSILSIVQDGTTLTASAPPFLSFTGATTATGFRLSQSGLPSHVSCSGGFYDAFLNLGGTLEADGMIHVTQGWSLLPPASFPGCPPCSKSWTPVS